MRIPDADPGDQNHADADADLQHWEKDMDMSDVGYCIFRLLYLLCIFSSKRHWLIYGPSSEQGRFAIDEPLYFSHFSSLFSYFPLIGGYRYLGGGGFNIDGHVC
jgi:hypothetical protein